MHRELFELGYEMMRKKVGGLARWWHSPDAFQIQTSVTVALFSATAEWVGWAAHRPLCELERKSLRMETSLVREKRWTYRLNLLQEVLPVRWLPLRNLNHPFIRLCNCSRRRRVDSNWVIWKTRKHRSVSQSERDNRRKESVCRNWVPAECKIFARILISIMYYENEGWSNNNDTRTDVSCLIVSGTF